MKKPLAAVVLAAATVATLAIPAGAAVPDKPASIMVPCYNEPGVARVWTAGHKLAADNPCAGQWLSIDYGPQYASGNYENEMDVAPGAHFAWSKKETAAEFGPVPSPGWSVGINPYIRSCTTDDNTPTAVWYMTRHSGVSCP